MRKFLSILGFFLNVMLCYTTPIQSAINSAENIEVNTVENGTAKLQSAENNAAKLTPDLQPAIFDKHNATTADMSKKANVTNSEFWEDKDAIIIDLEEVTKMSPMEYIGRQIRSLWDYLLHGDKEEKESSFVGRCAKLAKRLGQLIPLLTAGGAIIIAKLALLILFTLKNTGLLGLLLLLNVGSIAAKLGALFGSKKSGENLHVHVDKSDEHEHTYSKSHLHGPPYGWDDRNDINLEEHELYNLYEKLKLENDFKKLLSSVRRDRI